MKTANKGLFNVEYADVLGIPFDFTAKPVVAPPQTPRETIQVKAVRPERDALEIRFPRVQGYRVELPEERLSATFNADSVLELTPDLVGPSVTKNAGIIGQDVDLSLEHLGDMRRFTLLFHLTQRLLYSKWRDPGEAPKLYLFGQLKRITKQWLDTCLVCKGGTYPAQLMYQELADMACGRITTGITRALEGKRPVKAVLDSYNPTGSTIHVNFNTSKADRWETDARRCHINWIILDSDWEAEFCRVAESHPRVRSYVKNRNLGLEVPYLYGSEPRTYLPDFIVLVDDGHGDDDLLHLIVEIKGYRREDAKEKKATMETYWVPGVNNLGTYGRWAFAEFTDVYQIESGFEEKVESEFNQMITSLVSAQPNDDLVRIDQAAALIVRNLGPDSKWIRINSAIWRAITSTDNHLLTLTDVDAIAGSTSSSGDDALAVLALLCSPSIGIMRMEFRSEDGEQIPSEDVIRKLRDWWREKKLSEEEWQDWASRILVNWVPVGERASGA